MTNYFLGEKSLSPRSEAVEISESDFRTLNWAKSVFDAILKFEVKFLIIMECYQAIEMNLFRMCFERSIIYSFDRESNTDVTIRVNQDLLSLLTSVRAYHDQRTQDLSVFSGSRDSWPDEVKRVYSKIFDKNFEYRVMEALRNFAQHHQIPVQKFYFGGRRNVSEVGISNVLYTIDPEINLLKIAQNTDMNAKIRREIIDIGIEWIDLKLAVRRYVSGILEGHNEVRSMTLSDLESAKAIYKKFAERYKSSSPFAKDAQIILAYCEPDIGMEVYLGSDLLSEIERVSLLYARPIDLSQQYISTEVVRLHPKHPTN